VLQVAKFADEITAISKNLAEWGGELATYSSDYIDAHVRQSQVLTEMMDTIWDVAGVGGRQLDADEAADAARMAQNAYDDWLIYGKGKPGKDPGGLFAKWEDLSKKSKSLIAEIDELQELKSDMYNKIGSEGGKKIDREAKKAGAEAVLTDKGAELTGKVVDLAQAEGARVSILSQIGQATVDGAVAAALMYSFVYEISVKKTCPEGQTLNEYTCECCEKCTGGKVHPVGTADGPLGTGLVPSLVGKVISCDCVCPEPLVPCLTAFPIECFDPCPGGMLRVGSDCHCPSSSSSSNACGPEDEYFCTYTYNYHEAGGGIFVLGWYMSDDQCGIKCMCAPLPNSDLPAYAYIGRRINLACVPTRH